MFVLLLHLSLQIDTLHENKISLISACIYYTSRSTTVLHEKQHLSNSVKGNLAHTFMDLFVFAFVISFRHS